jgi:hypothetical protein
VNLVKATPDEVVFLLSPAEKQAWTDLLKLYPIQSAVVQPRDRPNAAERALLEEALSAQRRKHRAELEQSLLKEQLFVPEGDRFKVTLSAAHIEMMLQVLNDLRVGSWYALGCPDQLARKHIAPSDADFRHVWVMELSGHFQMALLEACGAFRP